MWREPAVFVVDDNDELRASLVWLLESVGHQVTAYSSAQAFLDAHDVRRPGCLILDVRMPGMSGIELQNRLKELGAQLHLIFVTGHASVKLAVQAMRDGAVDLFEKPVDEQVLLDRVQQVMSALRARSAERETREVLEARFALLSPREREVLALVVDGKRTKEVASALNLSPKTVDVHRANIMEKMRTHTVAQLVAAIKELGATR